MLPLPSTQKIHHQQMSPLSAYYAHTHSHETPPGILEIQHALTHYKSPPLALELGLLSNERPTAQNGL
jgi:hypothetical protein